MPMDMKDIKPLTDEEIREMERKLAEINAKRQVRKMMEEKRRAKRAWFDAIFPEFADVPIGWLIIGVICVLFSLFTLIV